MISVKLVPLDGSLPLFHVQKRECSRMSTLAPEVDPLVLMEYKEEWAPSVGLKYLFPLAGRDLRSASPVA